MPECRRAISAQVEREFRSMGYKEEAEFCKIVREFSEVFDKTGIDEKFRIERCHAMQFWLESRLGNEWTFKSISSHFPKQNDQGTAIPSRISRLCNEKFTNKKQGSLPVDLIEALILAIYSYLWTYESILDSREFKDYLMSENDSRKLPVVVGRSLGSANCESSFSDIKNCIEQKGRGKKSIPKPEQVSSGLKKWWMKQTLKTTIANSTDKNNFYSKVFHFKDIQSTKDWCDPAKFKLVCRRDVENSQKSLSIIQAEDPLASSGAKSTVRDNFRINK